MKRQRESKVRESRIYSFGAVLIQEEYGEEKLRRGGARTLDPELDRELRRGNMYRNKLLEIAERSQAAYRQIRRDHSPELDAVETQIDALDARREALLDEIRERRRADHSRRLHAAREEHGADAEVAKKRERYPDIEDRLDEIAEERKRLSDEAKGLRQPFDTLIRQVNTERKRREGELAVSRGYGTWDISTNKAGEEVRKYVGRDNHGKARCNAEVMAEMLADPEAPQAWKRVRESEKHFEDEKWLARGWIDLLSGTKGLIDKARDEAVAAVSKKQKHGEFARLNYRKRYTGDGRVGFHFGNGATFAALCSAMTGLRFRERPADEAETKHGRVAYDVHVPVTPGRGPRCSRFMVLMHRPLPDGALIKDAWILARRRGDRTVFSLQLSCSVLSATIAREKGEAVAALHLAWREDDGDLRAGYFDADAPIVDRQGRDIRGPVRVPQKARDDLRMARVLRSYQDTHWDEIKPLAIEWLETTSDADQRECATIDRWRNPIRLVQVVERVAAERLGERLGELWTRWLGERIVLHEPPMPWAEWRPLRRARNQDLFPSATIVRDWAREQGAQDATTVSLAWWARKHRHLVDWEERLRTRALGHRDEALRVVIAHARRGAATLLIDDQDLRKSGKKAAENEAVETGSASRDQGRMAAPGTLRKYAKEVFADDAVVVEIAGMASRCGECGGALPKQGGIIVTCENGHSFDRDENVTRQMRERFGAPQTPVGARSGTGYAGSDEVGHAAE